MSFTPPNLIAPFWGWTQFTPALPSFYWDVYSAEERVKKICLELYKLCEYACMLAENINLDHAIIEELQTVFTKFMESGFDDYYREQIEQWVEDNLGSLFETYSRGVYFGLTLDGHFVAYVPESWNDIEFDTGINYELDTYGRLILRMDVDSPYNVDQRPEVVRPYDDAPIIQQQIDNLMQSLYNTEGEDNGST